MPRRQTPPHARPARSTINLNFAAAELPLSFLITATHLDNTAKMRAKWRKKRVRRLKRKRRKTRARS
ncbi:hypothetical protein KCU67_g11015, partial [Aureobasidium melanogenum]